MNAPTDTYSAALLDVLVEVAALLEECSAIAVGLEQAIGDWLSRGADAGSFPVVELQGIDLLRQIQQDLSALLSSDALAQEITRSPHRVDIAAVIGTPKLERVRDRLMQLAGGRFDLVEPPDASADGRVDLF